MNVYEWLLKIKQRFCVWMLLSQWRVPTESDGIRAGRMGVGEEERRRQLAGEFALKRHCAQALRERPIQKLTVERSSLEKTAQRLGAEEEALTNRGHGPGMRLFLIAVAIGGTAAEVAITFPLTELYFITTVWLQVLVAISLVLIPAVGLHIALSRRRSGPFDHVSWRRSIGVTAFGVVVGIMWLRFTQLGWTANRGENFRAAFGQSSPGIALVMLLSALLLTIVVTYVLFQLEEGSEISRLGRTLARLKRRIQKLEMKLSTTAVDVERDRNALQAAEAIALACFDGGLAIGRKTAGEPRLLDMIAERFDLPLAIPAAIPLFCAAAILGQLVTSGSEALGLSALTAIMIGILTMLGVGSWALCCLLPKIAGKGGASLKEAERNEPALRGWWHAYFGGLDMKRVWLIGLCVLSASLIAGLLLTLLLARTRIPTFAAAIIGILSSVLLSTGALLWSLPAMTEVETGGDQPPIKKGPIRALASITAVLIVLIAVLMASCSNPLPRSASIVNKARDLVGGIAEAADHHPEPRSIVVALDVSKSVKATDDERRTAALSVLAHAHRGDTVSVVPIMDRAGEYIPVTLPRELVPFDDDLIEIARNKSTELEAKLPKWRRDGGAWSDYQHGLVLASEFLGRQRLRILVIIGDLVDDQPPGVGTRSPRPPQVPELAATALEGTRVYLGFVSSDELDRLSVNDRRRFEDNWRSELTRQGATDVTVRAFGVQSLDGWLDQVLGAPRRSGLAVR